MHNYQSISPHITVTNEFSSEKRHFMYHAESKQDIIFNSANIYENKSTFLHIHWNTLQWKAAVSAGGAILQSLHIQKVLQILW